MASLIDTLSPQEQLDALKALIESPGWKLYAEWLDRQLSASAATVASSTDPNVLMKQSGAMAALTVTKSWPTLHVQHLITRTNKEKTK